MTISFRPRILFISSIVFAYFFFTIHAVQATEPLAILPDVNRTLDPSITYTVASTVVVPEDTTLTIPAGTHLIFTAGSRIVVYGTLKAEGTASDHIVMTGGTPPPYIPFFIAPLAAPSDSPDSADNNSIGTTQTPESMPIVIPDIVPEVETPEVQSPEVAPLIVTTSIEMPTGKETFDSVTFLNGSTGTLKYVDVSNASAAIKVDGHAQVTADHLTITDCNYGVQLGMESSMTLTNTVFTTVSEPGIIDIHSGFTHTNNTFNNTHIPGWTVGGGAVPGNIITLDSTDGVYYLPHVTISGAATLIVKPGVKIFEKDTQGMEINGTLSMVGTEDAPITIYGDGACTEHEAAITATFAMYVGMSHVQFKNLCAGIHAYKSSIDLNHVDFETVAGTAIEANESSEITATALTMYDVYQAIKSYNTSRVELSDTTIDTVNTNEAAIDIDRQTPLKINDSTISNAATCIAVSNNSSLVANHLTLTKCSKVGILSQNADSGPTGITVVNSDISKSGTAMKLDKALVLDVSYNNFHDNTAGVSLHAMPKTILINNDWGSVTGPKTSSNPGGDGDTLTTVSVPEVVYRPWIGMSEPPEHNPIIIIPGITGSVLTKNYGDGIELWPNIPKLALSPADSYLSDLALLQNGTPSSTRPVIVGDIIRSAASTDVFTSMIATLSEHGYVEGTNLFVLPYDWRLSNKTSQALLEDTIVTALSKSGKSKVNIIAHSMGGILTKEYIAQHPDAPIDHLFYIGVPHTGAPKAFKTLMYGDDMGFKFSLGTALQVPVLDPDRIKIISQNMPSVYELLPSKKYVESVGSYITDLTSSVIKKTYDDIKAFMIADGRNEKIFPFAEAVHNDTDNLDVSKFDAYDFVGCGSTKTIGGFTITRKQSISVAGLTIVPEYRVRYVGGDSVVPLNSANAGNGATNYYINTGSHGTLPSVSKIQSAIVDILDGKPIKTNTTGFSSTSDSCDLPGETVEVHSPVTLDIYDDQGRHTGPLANGEIEMGIPNVQYDMIGEEKFAFLPSGPTYTIVNHAQAVGTYDMYISQGSQHDDITHEVYFGAVPITNLTTTGTVTVNSSGNYVINMDENNDGTIDSIITPSASIAGYQAIETVPPTTYFKLENTTVTLSAYDETAGVLNTKYSTDNVHWNMYNAPFEVTPGTTVYFLSIDKAGNTEDIQHREIPAAPSSDTPDTDNPPSDTDPGTETPSDTTPDDTNDSDTSEETTPPVYGGGGGGGIAMSYGPSSVPTTTTKTIAAPLVDAEPVIPDTSIEKTNITDHPITESATIELPSAEIIPIPLNDQHLSETTIPDQLLASADVAVPFNRKILLIIVLILIFGSITAVFLKNRR